MKFGGITLALVLQRRFLNLVSFWPEIASRKARQQSCQARGQVAMKRCSAKAWSGAIQLLIQRFPKCEVHTLPGHHPLLLNQSQGGIYICGAMKIDLGAQGSSCSCVRRAIRCRRLTSSIRVFHLGISLGDWLNENADVLGRRYVSELQRKFRR